MTHKILGIWLYFGLFSMVSAQESFTIKGSVLDSKTMEPIEGVTIIGTDLFSISLATGEFIIKNVYEGNHTFTISHLGYTSYTLLVKVESKMDVINILLSESTTDLDEVEIHSKTKTRVAKELPMSSHIITKEFLNKNRKNSLMQTLKKIPGVSTMTIGSGQSKPVIRGLGFNRVAVVQNGIKHEAQQWGNDHGLEIDQYGIENIQIIKGPASLLFGSDAIAGVVDIQPSSIPLRNSFSGEVNILGESNNELLGISTGIQSRKENWFYRGRITYRDYGDYKVPTTKINYENYIFELHNKQLRNTAGEEANASFSVGYVNDNIQSETFFSNVYSKNGFFANAHGLEVRTSSIDYDRSSRDIDLPFHRVNHFKITNNTTIYRGDHTFQIDFGFQNNHREEHSEPVPHGYMPKPPNTEERVFNKNSYAFNVKDSFKPNAKHNIVVGINMEYQDNSIAGWGFLIPNYNRYTIGAFAYDQYGITPDLHFQVGLRYDYGFLATKAYYDWYPSTLNNSDGSTSSVHLRRSQDKNLSFGSISASAGLSYIQKNTTYKINLGKGFRMPLANELASDGVNYHMYQYEKGNLNLDPEESYQLDIDIDHTAKNFSFGISPFANIFDNYIYLNPTPNYYETLQIYEYTQSKVLRFGGEIRAVVTLFENLHLDASGEYIYSRQTSGAKNGFTLPFSPPLSGLFSANYQFKKVLFLNKLQLMTEFQINAKQDEIVPPEASTKGSQVFNMSLLSDINVPKNNLPMEMRIKLNNVFNTKYYDHTSFYRLIDVPEAGRNLSVSLTIPF